MRPPVPFLLLAALAAGCASPAPPEGTAAPSGLPGEGARPSIVLTDHFLEVPRLPHPGYHRDGVVISELAEDSAWARAGLRAGDVIESVNGREVVGAEEVRRACGGGEPSRVRLVRSRLRPPAPLLPLPFAGCGCGCDRGDGLLRIPLVPPSSCPGACRLVAIEVEA